MSDWLALKNLLVMLLVFGLSMLLIASLVAADNASLLVPSPKQTAEGLVGALGAHRYTGALGELSQDLQKQVNRQDLQQIVQAIENSRQGIQDAHGKSSQEQGQEATAEVQVTFEDQQETSLTFPLVKENGIWKVSSLNPLQALAGD